MSLELLIMRMLLRFRSRKGPVRKRARQYRPQPVLFSPEVGEVRVAAVQMAFRFVRSSEEFVDLIARRVALAFQEGAEIVVFPEDVGTMLLGVLPGFQRLEGAGTLDAALKTLGDEVEPVDLLELAGPAVRRIYTTTFAELARTFGIIIAAGSAMLPTPEGRIQNIGHLYGPNGLMLRQPKNHLLPLEFDWGLAVDDDMGVVNSPYGRLAMPICMDASFFEPFRILLSKEADIVLLPAADPTDGFNSFKSLRGIWPRVQESPLYGVQAAMVGGALGLEFYGKSGIYAPLDLTPQGDGIIAQARSAQEETIVIGDLDVLALRRYRQEHSPTVNEALYERYFPDIYQGHWRTEPRARRR